MNKLANTTAIYWLAAAFVVGFFSVGVPYWQLAYAKVSLPDTLYGAGLVGVGVLAAASRAFGKAPRGRYLRGRCGGARCSSGAGRC